MRFQAPESLSEQIARYLGERIIKGTLKPGERIQEMKIAGELDVSRGSVREALLILERRYLIRIYPRKGAVVSEISPDLVVHLYDIYIALLTMLAQKLAERWSGQDLVPLARQVHELENRMEAQDFAAAEMIDGGFGVMRGTYAIVGNPYLEETLENFRPAISRTYALALHRSRDEAEVTRHFLRNLIDQVHARDKNAIAALVQEFADHQRTVVLRVLSEEAQGSGTSTSRTGS